MTTQDLDADALISLVDQNVQQLVAMSVDLQEIVRQLRQKQARIEGREPRDDG